MSFVLLIFSFFIFSRSRKKKKKLYIYIRIYIYAGRYVDLRIGVKELMVLVGKGKTLLRRYVVSGVQFETGQVILNDCLPVIGNLGTPLVPAIVP